MFSLHLHQRYLALIAWLVLSAGAQAQLESSQVVPNSRAATLEACVAPTEDMRRNHMEHLFHKRALTMHNGIRSPEFSLNGCVACHAAQKPSGEFVPVSDDEQFCQSCHARVAQKIDCFECHRTTPESGQ